MTGSHRSRRGSRFASLVVTFLALALAASCGDNAAHRDAIPHGKHDARPEEDASPDVPDAVDAPTGVDAGIDAAPPSLVELCGAEPTTFEDWERCFQRRKCARIVNCSEKNRFRDVQECVETGGNSVGGGLARDARRRALEAGRAFRDDEAFTRCLREMRPDDCRLDRNDPLCAPRYRGTVADHDRCEADIECASPGAHCVRSCADACCDGTCVPQARLGEACVEFNDCEPGLVCSIATNTCLTGEAGEPCEEIGDCDTRQWCDEREGICKADLPEGAPCSTLLACGGETTCVGLIRGGEPTCRRVTRPGDACDWFCLGNTTCAFRDRTSLGMCVPLPGRGEPCGLLLPCHGRALTCDRGVCVNAGREGAPCGKTGCVPGFFCSGTSGDVDRSCTAPRADGGPCRADEECSSGLCSGDATTLGTCRAWPDRCDAGETP